MSDIAVITGGAGFIGSHVVDEFIEAGYIVHVIDDLSTGSKENINAEATLHELDIRSEEVAALFAEISPNVLVHLAAHIDLRQSVKFPKMDADINIIGGLNVLTAAIEAGVKHVSFASTAAVYSQEKTIPTREDNDCLPTSPYGLSKKTFEAYLDIMSEIHGFMCAKLRFANVYGPRQTVHGEAGVVAIFFNKMKGGGELTINGDGEQTRDYVYVGDVAKAVCLATKNGVSGVFNVSTGIETSVNALLAMMADVSGIEAKITNGPAKAGDDPVSCLDPKMASTALGWTSNMELTEGLRQTWEYLSQ